VTAGVWLLIRFSLDIRESRNLFIFFGGATLIVARLAALLESDAKKVVALSTLSQLGLILIGLFMGGAKICLLHLLTHALAKANLFLIVGSILY
jgi:NADH:ubiquinone oxidoreductase subunit 5 (subunit L)/multisubunit Na+/H+ antiporter MnhA subunit